MEDAELAVDPHVDAGGLHQRLVVGIEDQPPGRDLRLDCAVAEHHRDPVYFRPKGSAPGARYVPQDGLLTRRETEIADQTTRSAEGMHVCPSCSSGLVQPAQWFEQGEGRWHVDLRCPECEWWGRGSFSQDEVDSFDESSTGAPRS